jgi:hypothetical protein
MSLSTDIYYKTMTFTFSEEEEDRKSRQSSTSAATNQKVDEISSKSDETKSQERQTDQIERCRLK